MCYFGYGDTFTPIHKDICGSIGQNLMCYTENGGSAFWFLTSGASSIQASRWMRQQGLDAELETFFERDGLFAHDEREVGGREEVAVDFVRVIEDDLSCHRNEYRS